MSAPTAAAIHPPCRFCAAPLTRTVVDLGMSPLCETFLTADELNHVERFYPLHVRVCDECHLVQLEQYVSPDEIFTEYAYFSSYSDSWVAHAKAHAERMIGILDLDETSTVVELASNDGYLLQHFVARGIPVVGVEPAANVAAVAVEKGIPTRVAFFGRDEATAMVAEGIRADLLCANNVLAHVPDINDFVAGIAIVLGPDGVATLEFPHLARLIAETQYDTIYHEHFSYLSLMAAHRIMGAHGLAIFDVEQLPSHGGSLRIHVGHADRFPETDRVRALTRLEQVHGFDTPRPYEVFGAAVEASKRALLTMLIAAREAGEQVAAYGAPGKGNTLLNYCGIRSDLISYAVDRNPYKHGRYTPGTHIPIFAPERLAETKPDVIVILPWNLRKEIAAQLAYTAEWGARLVVPIPTTTVISEAAG